MEMEGEFFEIYVSTSFMIEYKDALPDEVHGRANPSKLELFKLILPRKTWRAKLVSGDGGLHIRRRSAPAMAASDE